MKRQILMLLIFVISFSVLGCGSTVKLEGTAWVLESYGERGNLKAVLADTEITATFKSDEQQVTGSGGCNSYGGTYELAGNNLSIPEPLISTMMSCGEEKDRQEQQFYDALQSAESYGIENGKLTINCGSNILVFKQK